MKNNLHSHLSVVLVAAGLAMVGCSKQTIEDEVDGKQVVTTDGELKPKEQVTEKKLAGKWEVVGASGNWLEFKEKNILRSWSGQDATGRRVHEINGTWSIKNDEIHTKIDGDAASHMVYILNDVGNLEMIALEKNGKRKWMPEGKVGHQLKKNDDTVYQGAVGKYTIREIMQKSFKQEGNLKDLILDGKATAEQKAQFIDYVENLAQYKIRKGDAASWKEKTDALIAAAKGIDLPALEKATNCKACHSVHKIYPPKKK